MHTDAIQSALALFREPGRIADFRDRPLPEDVGQVIRVAAGEAAAVQAGQEATEESADTLTEASIFYLQQMLFVANADSYRVLGLTADAPQQQLREHYRWLMRWLHPDRNPDGWEVVYADRVNAAWQDLKTKERRAEYNVRAPSDATAHGLVPMSSAPMRIRTQAPDPHRPFLSGAMVRRLPAIIFGALSVSALAVLGLMYWAQIDSQREAELAAQRAAGTELAENPAENQAAAGTDDAVAAANDLLAKAQEPAETSAVTSAVPVQVVPSVSEAPATAAGAMPAGEDVTASVTEPAAIPGDANTAPAQVAIAEPAPPAEPVVATADPIEVAPAPVAVVAEPVSVAAEAESDVVAAPPVASAPVERAPLPKISPTMTGSSIAVTPASMAVAPAQTTPPPATVALAVAPPPEISVAASKATVAPVVSPEPVPVKVVQAPVPSSRTPSPAAVATAPPVVVAPKAPARVALARVSTPPEPLAAAPEVVASASIDPALSAAPTSPEVAPAAVVEPVSLPPARNVAQQLVGEMVSAYASGNLARFDNLFSQGSGGAGRMRTRMQSTQMRYLEMGEVDWNLTQDSAVGRASYRDTFVPRGAKKAVTQAGQIHLIVRVDAGRARISSLEVASIASN